MTYRNTGSGERQQDITLGLFVIGFSAPSALGGAPLFCLRAATHFKGYIRKIRLQQTQAIDVSLSFAPPKVDGTPATQFPLEPTDQSGVASQTQIETTWTVGHVPSIDASIVRLKAQLAQGQGFVIEWDFPEDSPMLLPDDTHPLFVWNESVGASGIFFVEITLAETGALP